MPENQIKITSIEVSDLVKVLKRSGSRHVSEEKIKKDIASGAPVNDDGTVNLIHYTAWLLKGGGNGP
jgi:hypothetical protein